MRTPGGIAPDRTEFACLWVGLCSIEYTQHFSGAIDRKALIECLCKVCEFCERGEVYSAMEDGTQTIMANTRTGVHSSLDGYKTHTNVCNMIISLFKAGEVQTKFGGKLYEYEVNVPPAEVAGSKLSSTTAQEVVAEALALVLPPDHSRLFVVQPPELQWNNLASKLV